MDLDKKGCYRKAKNGKGCNKGSFGGSFSRTIKINHEDKKSDTDNDEICVIEPTPLTPVQATEAVEA